MKVPVASGNVLILVRVVCFDRWLQVPNLLQKVHVLLFEVGLLLLLSEHLSS